MAMTKRHFTSIALHLAEVRPDTIGPERRTWEACVHAMAQACAANSLYCDVDRFKTAAYEWQAGIRNGVLVRVK